MNVRDAVQDLVAGMPEDVTWDEVQYRLWLRRIIDESDTRIAGGEGIPQETVEERLAGWLESP